MSKTVAIRGSLLVSDGACGCSTDQTTKPVALGGSSGICDAGLSYDQAAAFSTSIATIGAVGAAFVDIPGLGQFTSIEFLRVVSSARVRFRVNPTRPTLTASAPIPSTGVQAGTAEITVTNSTGTQYTATVTFSPSTNTPALVVGAINAALAGAGAPFPPDGQIARLTGSTLVLVSPGIGPSAFLELTAGAPIDLGLGVDLVTVEGDASDLPDSEGLVVLQFPRYPYAPASIQVSGVATLDIVAAGRVTA